MTIITNENAREYYKEFFNELDTSETVLKEEEKEEIRKDIATEIRMRGEYNPYQFALDWNVTIVVLKKVLKG